MKCDICKNKEATIHIQEVVNNNIKSLHICEKCAKSYGLKNELIDIGFHLMDFIHNYKTGEDKLNNHIHIKKGNNNLLENENT